MRALFLFVKKESQNVSSTDSSNPVSLANTTDCQGATRSTRNDSKAREYIGPTSRPTSVSSKNVKEAVKPLLLNKAKQSKKTASADSWLLWLDLPLSALGRHELLNPPQLQDFTIYNNTLRGYAAQPQQQRKNIVFLDPAPTSGCAPNSEQTSNNPATPSTQPPDVPSTHPPPGAGTAAAAPCCTPRSSPRQRGRTTAE